MTLMSFFQGAMSFGLAILIAFAFVAVLMSPIIIGRLIASRCNNRVKAVVGVLLGIVAFLGARNIYHDFPNLGDTSYLSMGMFFVPIYVAMGFVIGTGHKRERELLEKRLGAWRAQLETDRGNGSVPQRLVADYREIAAVLNSLGRREEAAAEYRQAMTIMEMSLAGHPAMAECYRGYLALISRKKNAEQYAEVKAKLDAVKDPFR